MEGISWREVLTVSEGRNEQKLRGMKKKKIREGAKYVQLEK